MRVLVHDYSGHPFQVQLSRELARRGHEVLHLHCSSFLTGKGALERRPGDPATFAVEGIGLGVPFEKYAFVKRWRQERQYGQLCADRIERFRPDVVISSNTPLFAQQKLLGRVRSLGTRFVFWQQDIYAVAMASIIKQRLPVVGGAAGKYFVDVERRMLSSSDHVVAISSDFLPILDSWGVPERQVTVIENWAPMDEIDLVDRPTSWAVHHGLANKMVFLYSGTLGLKHNPGILWDLANSVRDRDDVRIVVISEGWGADWLKARFDEDPNDSILLLPYQPYEVLPQVLASADVLLAILEPEAGVFSVPSKVLTYHCAGRPILGAIPAENLAARTIERAGSGVVVDPTDHQAFVAAARRLLEQPELRARMGARGRAYASATFDITSIGEQFEEVLSRATDGSTTEQPRKVHQ